MKAAEFEHEIDLAEELFASGDVNAGMWQYVRTANRVWHQADQTGWEGFVARSMDTGLIEQFHEDPLTAHSYLKPRGYAGDAELLDLIYDHEGANSAAVEATSSAGKMINSIVWNGPETKAVRWRRNYAATMLDRLKPGSSRVLSIAAGSCRELSVLDTTKSGQLDRFVALDQDEQSLAEAKRSYAGVVEPITADAGSLIRSHYDVGEFDLIYSLGLLDYLSQRATRSLLRNAVSMAARNATICVANFTPEPFNIGYVESAMAWELIYRNERELMELSEEAILDRTFTATTFRDPEGTIAYLNIALDTDR